MEIKNFRHVGIVTSNLKTSLKFYQEVFGLKISKSLIENHPSLAKIMGFKKVEVKTVKLKDRNSIILELLEWRYPKTKQTIFRAQGPGWEFLIPLAWTVLLWRASALSVLPK